MSRNLKLFKFLKFCRKYFFPNIKTLFLNLLTVFFLFIALFVLWFAFTEIPDAASFENRRLNQSTKIYDRTGQVLLYDLSQNVKRTVLPLKSISEHIIDATLAVEDSDFYNHNGIKIDSIVRAIFKNILSFGPTQGGSTITQQLVKKSLLTDEKLITRKIKEWILALKIEKKLTKEEILERYLNEMPYGGTVYGVEEASYTFFNKSAKDVSLVEAAYLASVLKGPTYYSPYGKHRQELEDRKNFVLLRMKEEGFITEAEYNSAIKEVVDFKEKFGSGIKAPHFVMFVRDYLEENYGDKMIQNGGLKVITTLNYEFQKKSEEIIKEYALKNAKDYNATNAGLVIIDPRSGEILTMVGSRDYFDNEIQGNFNITTAKRQPGSSFKPIVYAGAFEKGYQPETVLFDTQTQFSANCRADDFRDTEGCYSPGNYDGKFRGPMTIKNALAQSINIPAVKALYLLGIDNAINLAKKMGITTLNDPDRYGLTLVLGGGEVTLLEMTGAYSIFASEGEKRPITSILKIEDKVGNIIEEKKDVEPERVVSRNTALLISDILSDDNARSPIFGRGGSLHFPGRDVAAKTGTTNNYRDAWVIGYTPQIVIGAWSGNNDNSPIDKKVAGYIVAPMWHKVFNEVLSTLPNEKFNTLEGRDLSNLKPVLRGVWNQGIDTHTILYYINKNEPLSLKNSNYKDDPQFERWEYGVSKWVRENLNTFTDTGINDSVVTDISFSSPKTREEFNIDDRLKIEMKIGKGEKVSKVDYFINNSYVSSSNDEPFYRSTLSIKDLSLARNTHTLKAVVLFVSGKTKEVSTEFIVKP